MVSNSPWLMVSNQHHSDQVEEKHIKQKQTFLNVSTNLVHTLELPHDASGKRKTICGFSRGWLIFFDKQNSSLTLLNPFTGHQVNNLPQLPGNGTVHKAILSADPFCDSYEFNVLAIYGDKRELIGYEEATNQWTMLRDHGTHFEDILVESEDALVAVSELGKLVIYEPPVCNEHVPASFFHGKKVYLVSIHAELFMLVSFSGRRYYFEHETYEDELRRFEVYRYDEGKWCGTIDLRGYTIFLGHNHSLAVRNAPGFRPNCIYFTEDDEGNVENMGVLNLNDGEARRMQWFMPPRSTKKCVQILG